MFVSKVRIIPGFTGIPFWLNFIKQFFVKKNNNLVSFVNLFLFYFKFYAFARSWLQFFFAMLYLEDEQESPPPTQTKSTEDLYQPGSPRNLIQIMKWFYFKTNLSL